MPKPAECAGAQGAETSLDEFLGGRIACLQPTKGHRSGTDAVFLAAAALAGDCAKSGILLDAGAGAGVAGLCLAARFDALHIIAVEADPAAAALARANAVHNGFADRVTVVEADLTAPARDLAARGLQRESCDHLIANPPFYREGSVRGGIGKARAHILGDGMLESWIRFLTTMAKAGAGLTIIHRPDALGELLPALSGRFGGVTVFPLFPKEGRPASRVLVKARKGSRAPLRILPGLVLHHEDGAYTAEAEAVLRHGEGLDFGI